MNNLLKRSFSKSQLGSILLGKRFSQRRHKVSRDKNMTKAWYFRKFQLLTQKNSRKKTQLFSKVFQINWNLSQDAGKCRQTITIHFDDHNRGGFSVFRDLPILSGSKWPFFRRKARKIEKVEKSKFGTRRSKVHRTRLIPCKFHAIGSNLKI